MSRRSAPSNLVDDLCVCVRVCVCVCVCVCVLIAVSLVYLILPSSIAQSLRLAKLASCGRLPVLVPCYFYSIFIFAVLLKLLFDIAHSLYSRNCEYYDAFGLIDY